MILRTLPIEQLKPAPYNPRKPLQPGSAAYRRLARSIDEFDLVQPIVWNEQTGHVVGGHQRLEILRHKGAREIEVAVVSLSLEREKALNVALNNAQLASDWDVAKLTNLVAELSAVPDFDPTLTGFDEKDLRDLLLSPAEEPPADESAEPADVVRVVLEVPLADWESLRPEFDRFLAEHPLKIHVKLPG